MHQKTISLPISHPVRAMEGLAKQIALPHEHMPLRFPSFPALERTAVLGFSCPTTVTLAASTATKMLLFRQAAYPAWAEQTFTDSAYWATYSCDSELTGTQVSSGQVRVSLLSKCGVGNVVATNDSAGISGYSQFASSPYPIMGVDAATGPLPWIYTPANCFVNVVVGGRSTFTNSTTAGVNWEVWLSPGEVTTSTSPDATITATQRSAATGGTATMPGRWVRPVSISYAAGTAQAWPQYSHVTVMVSTTDATFVGSTSTLGTLTCKTPSVNAVVLFPLVYPVEFSNSTLPWYATRTTAAALLGTNVTQITKKGGTILGGRVSPLVESPWRVTSSYVNSLHPAEKAFLPLETGVYTYAPPSTDMANFYDYTLPTGPNILASATPLFRLDNDSLYNVMFITASSDAESMAVTVDWHIEFRTSSALFEVGLCTMSLESLHTAQISLAAAGFFFENPTHGKILSKVVEATKKYGPGLISMVNPLAGRALKTMITLSKSPAKTNKMKPTSSEGSGLTAKPTQGKRKGKGKSKKAGKQKK